MLNTGWRRLLQSIDRWVILATSSNFGKGCLSSRENRFNFGAYGRTTPIGSRGISFP